MSQHIKSQIVFCPPGAEWHFSFYELTPDPSLKLIINETIKYAGDSVVNNENFKILRHKKFFKNYGLNGVLQSYIKQSGDTVFFSNLYTNNNWQILYNFAALAGQSWTTNLYPFSSATSTSTFANTYTISVDSTGYVNINNFNLKLLYVKYKSYNDLSSVTITERLGCKTFLFNYRYVGAVDGGYFQDNLCYQDSVFGLKQYTAKPCNYADATGLRENNYQNAVIKIYPNPSAGHLILESETLNQNEDYTMSVFNAIGQAVAQEHIKAVSHRLSIDLRPLEPGMYYLQLSNKNGLLAAEKIIKKE